MIRFIARHGRIPAPSLLSAAVLASVCAATSAAQSACDPETPCTPTPVSGAAGAFEFRYLTSGTIREVFVRPNPQNTTLTRVWTAEDGGRIRYSTDSGTSWTYQETPSDARQQLLDVYFLPDAETGWACGVGGVLLKTIDHGVHWNVATTGAFTDQGGVDPAVLWGVRFPQTSQFGFAAGLKTFKYLPSGSSTWTNVKVFDAKPGSVPAPTEIDVTQLEIYFVETVATSGGGWIGLAGAEWEREVSPGVEISTGLILRGRSNVSGGIEWWIVHESETMIEPWDAEFENQSFAVLVGSGDDGGHLFATGDGGLTWREEFSGLPSGDVQQVDAMYGVAALGGYRAIACGYQGDIWYREPSETDGYRWYPRRVSGFTAPLTGAAARIDESPTTNETWVSGTVGFLRHSLDPAIAYGATNRLGDWASQNNCGGGSACCVPLSASAGCEIDMRARDVVFLDASRGIIVGQSPSLSKVAYTTNGGCNFKPITPYCSAAPAPCPSLNAVAWNGSPTSALGIVAVGDDGEVVAADSDEHCTWSRHPNASIPATVDLVDVVARGLEFWTIGTDTTNGRPICYRSGANPWSVVGGFTSSDDGVTLKAITYRSNDDSFIAVGEYGATPKAYRLVNPDSGGTWSSVPVVVTAPAPAGALLAVASGVVGGTYKTYACGYNGIVVEWTGSQFNSLAGPETCVPSCVDMTVIAVEPVNERLLVGTQTKSTAAFSRQGGVVYRFDGTTWESPAIKSQASKDGVAFSFVETSPGVVEGFLLARQSGADTNFGTFADNTILKYEPEP